MESNSISELNICSVHFTWFIALKCCSQYIYIMFYSNICFGLQPDETIQYLEFLWWLYEPSCSENWRFFSHMTKSVSFIILNQTFNVQCGWSVPEHVCPIQSLSCRFVHSSVNLLHPVVNLCFGGSVSWTVMRALLRITIIKQYLTQGAWGFAVHEKTSRNKWQRMGWEWWSSWNWTIQSISSH